LSDRIAWMGSVTGAQPAAPLRIGRLLGRKKSRTLLLFFAITTALRAPAASPGCPGSSPRSSPVTVERGHGLHRAHGGLRQRWRLCLTGPPVTASPPGGQAGLGVDPTPPFPGRGLRRRPQCPAHNSRRNSRSRPHLRPWRRCVWVKVGLGDLWRMGPLAGTWSGRAAWGA
jgi:hypothetical protein